MPKIPGVNHLDAVRALEKAGFAIIRQGTEVIMDVSVKTLGIDRLNIDERLALVEEIWATICIGYSDLQFPAPATIAQGGLCYYPTCT